MRAVLDPNVIISALLSRHGSPARALLAWQRGAYELVVSPLLLDELERALGYPKLRRRITPDEGQAVLDWLGRSATIAADPEDPPSVRSVDPGDNYLIALAARSKALLVSGDAHLLALAGRLPIVSPVQFLDLLDR